MADRNKVPVVDAWKALLVASVSFGILSAVGMFPSGYFHLWSSNVAFSDRYLIDTPWKFIGNMALVMLNTGLNRYFREVLGSWQLNAVNDKKTPRCCILGTDHDIHLTIQIFYFYLQLSSTVSIFFTFVSFYFVLGQIAANAIAVHMTTNQFLHAKADYNTHLQGECVKIGKNAACQKTNLSL
mgnify:CR=1 FL=1